MPGPFFFGDEGDDPQMADAGTAADLLKRKFPGMFPDAAAGNGNAGAIPLFGSPTRPESAAAVPAEVPAPEIGQPEAAWDKYQLPWLRQFAKQAQPQRPPLTTPTGQLVPGATKGQMLGVLLRSGLQGALAGRAASEQAVIQSGGRRSGGAGLGFQAAIGQPLIQASQQQQLQRGQMQNQITQQQLAQTQALNAAYAAGTSKDPQSGAPSFDRQKVIQSVAASGQGALIPGLTQTFAQMDKTAGELQAQKDTHAKAEDEYVGAALAGIRNAKYDPAVAGATLAHLAQYYPEQAERLRRAIAANPGSLQQIVDTAIAQSPTQQRLANEAWKTVDGRLVNTMTGATMGEALPVDQLNTGLLQRYQVLNPGKQLPDSFTLKPNATAKDFDRIDKLMQQTESAQGTKAQREQTAAIRQQTLSMAQQNQQDREEKQGLAWVSWTDPSGRTVAGPLSMARQMGAQNPAQVPTEEIRNITDARNVLTMVNKQGDMKGDPSTWGVLQLASSLNKDGKMGAFTSRYNRMMTQGLGAEPNDDPRIITLLDKAQLMTTLTMKAHFGASGGRSPQMLAHFEALANAGKMDGGTFIAGTKAIADYMGDRAMLPGGSGGRNGAAANVPKAPTFADWKRTQGQR